MFLRVAKTQTFANGQPLTNSTGFFYLHDDFLYLVTARHVVINEATHQGRAELNGPIADVIVSPARLKWI